MNAGDPRPRRRRSLGAVLIAIGVGANKWVIERIVSPDGQLESPTAIALLVFCQVVLVLVGLLAVVGASLDGARRSSRWPSTVMNVALSVGAILFGVLLAENLLAVMGRAPSGREYPGDHPTEPMDPLVGWRMSHGIVQRHREEHGDFDVEYRTNSLGFRDDEFHTAGSDLDIAFVGDSFTFGSGVGRDRTFVERVAARIGANAMNFGMRGYGIDQMWLTVEHFALRFDPDYVVLTFVADDLQRSMTSYTPGGAGKPSFRLRDGRLERLTEENRPGEVRSWLQRHSRLLSLWHGFEWTLLQRRPFGSVWRLNRAIFEAIQARCEEAGIPLLVVYIPTDPHGGWKLGDGLGRGFADLGIHYLDMTPRFRGRAEALFFENDPHINSQGHQVVAEAIVEELGERPPLSSGS